MKSRHTPPTPGDAHVELLAEAVRNAMKSMDNGEIRITVEHGRATKVSVTMLQDVPDVPTSLRPIR